MVANYLAVATLPHLDGYARDDVKISSAWLSDNDSPSAVAARVAAFFTATQTTTKSVGGYIGGTRTRTASGCYVQVFDITGKLDGTPHGSAVLTAPFTLPADTGSYGLPSEVAACVSLRANTYTSALETGAESAIPTPARAQAMGAPATHLGRIRPRARLRGRMFIGPLNDLTMNSSDSDKRPKLNDTFRSTLGLAAQALAAQTDPHAQLHVWSRRNEDMHFVSTVLVDDAFDIQRRRGEKYVNRTSWTPA